MHCQLAPRGSLPVWLDAHDAPIVDMIVVGSLVLAIHDDDTLNVFDVGGVHVDRWTSSVDCSRVLSDRG